MTDAEQDAVPVPKIHPATREILPDDPLQMHGIEVPGDADLMLRLLVEEYARIGWGGEQIMQLARDDKRKRDRELQKLYGEQRMVRRVSEILSRCGVIRVNTQEKQTEQVPAQLVQIDLN